MSCRYLHNASVPSPRKSCVHGNSTRQLTRSSAVIYTVDRHREDGSKCVVSFLASFHTFVFVLVAWMIVGRPKDDMGTMIVGGFIGYIAVFSMPFIILLQIAAQYFELQKMTNYGVLSLQSVCMQAIVMAIIAIRLLIKTGFTFSSSSGKKESGFLTKLLIWYFGGFISLNYLLWIGGAILVYFATRSSKIGHHGRDVELGVLLE